MSHGREEDLDEEIAANRARKPERLYTHAELLAVAARAWDKGYEEGTEQELLRDPDGQKRIDLAELLRTPR